ncbi:MAG: EAL domain-containing protein [Proteobacteria bacterium]|nr:EAL domain-containing protein [Pseudomonadota bacterium]MDA1021887.1 EAL domain-containing protein [Pseudomonadota bacterium]
MPDSLENLKAANEVLKNELAERIGLQARTDAIARLSEENPDPVMRVSTQGAVLYANFAAIGLLTYLEIDIGDRLPEGWGALIDEAGLSKTAIDKEMQCGDNFYILTLQSVVDADYINIYGRDITKTKETEHQIVNFDDLTGLPNRALFQDRLEQVLVLARRTGKLAAVHLIDLDHFKDINETMGHHTGDVLLQGIAERLRECVRTSDTVARLGGDEFGIIQVDPADADGVAVLAQKLLNCFANPFDVDGRKIHTNASIGITVFPDDAESPEQALRNADLALYHGKGEGRGTYRFFVSKMHEDIQRRRSIEDDMREGLHRGEFVLHYQPKLNITTNRITGMEALVRWNHPQQGFMSPAEFIPVAERSKLIVPLGEWVLHEACSRNKAWTDAGLGPIKVAVNISAVQLQETDLQELVQGVLEDTGLDPSQLELEITESLAMNNAEASIELFKDLFDLGVSISIDDFGTGYSSLAYLRSFPVQRIKIDKAFVDDIGTDENSGVIARAVTTLGHSFGMEITAEGVETEDQLSFLRSLGCDEIQGYFFSRPLPGQELEAFLKNYEETWALKLSQERRGSIIDRRYVTNAQTITN